MSRRNSITKYFPEWATGRRKSITGFNPAKSTDGLKPVTETVYTVFDYSASYFEERKFTKETSCKPYHENGHVTWINVDGLKKNEVENLCLHFNIHPLFIEDILSVGQRAKMDETGEIIFCILPMLYFNEKSCEVETEQVSIVVGKDFLISFQEDPERDVFNPVRDRLRTGNARLRQSNSDYLCYSLLDVIVDSYFGVIEKLSDRLETLEDDLIMNKDEGALGRISLLRREAMVLKRAIMPVREVVYGFIRSGHPLLDERSQKYFKDVSDHIIQANEYCENQRDMLMNLQDLYMNQINLRMNEVMKIFTMVALLLAPATVIGGIFGMNFETIPLLHSHEGFFISVGAMLIIPLLMLVYFKKKKWF